MNHEEKALSYMDAHREELFSLLSRLIQFDSQNFITDGREAACAAYIEQLYRTLGLKTERYCPDDLLGIKEHPGYLPGRGTDHRPNVSGIWGGKGPGVMLAAHIDTMPTGDLSKWTVDPFGGVIQDGRIIGLGAGDNKAGIAAGYFAVKALINCGITLNMPVALAAYCDEEYGGGDGALAACLKYPCEICVNLDGGNYELWTAAIGGGGFELSLHKEDSTDSCLAVYEALEAVMEGLRPFIARRKAELHENPLYTGSDMERSAFRLARFGSTGTSHTDAGLTFVIYTVKSQAEIERELSDILKQAQPVFSRHSIVTQGFTPTTRFFGYYETDKTGGAVEVMRRAAEEAAGVPVRECGSCLTDLSVILPYGSSRSFNFGILRDFALPGGAHQPNEFVECGQFLAYTKALTLFLLRYCGGSETNTIKEGSV